MAGGAVNLGSGTPITVSDYLDPIVGKLQKDPANPEEFIVLVGYLGEAAGTTRWRVYLTLRMDEYVDFDEDDVVHIEPLAVPTPAKPNAPTGPMYPLGGHIVWLKADAPLYIKLSQRPTNEQARFFAGGIAGGFLPQVGIGGWAWMPAGSGNGAMNAGSWGCGTTASTPNCPG